jgi:hypothetical protein
MSEYKNIKVALIMSGDLRSFKYCYSSVKKNIIDYTGCDVFMHAYTSEEITDAIKLYKPKSLIINEKNNYNKKIKEVCRIHRAPETNVDNVFNMWKNIKNTFNLIEKKYDFIIKSRYDIMVSDKLYLKYLHKECINIPFCEDWRNGISDLFAVGNFDNMKHYCGMISKIEKYTEKENILFHPETLLKHHLKDKKINRFNMSVSIIR